MKNNIKTTIGILIHVQFVINFYTI